MKKELIINMSVVKEHGAVAAVVLAVIDNAYEPLSTTQVADAVGVTYPTAQKNLKILVGEGLIKEVGRHSARFKNI